MLAIIMSPHPSPSLNVVSSSTVVRRAMKLWSMSSVLCTEYGEYRVVDAHGSLHRLKTGLL